MISTSLNWKVLFFEGIAFFLLGIIAIAHPFMIAISLEFILGCLLTAAGLVQGFQALRSLKDPRSMAMLIGAAFALIAGILLLSYPLSGVLTLTLLLTIYFFLDGISRIVSSFQFRPMKGWVWLLVSGLLSFVLAILIISGLPISAVWVVGLYVGIYLMFLGLTFMTLSYQVRSEIG